MPLARGTTQTSKQQSRQRHDERRRADQPWRIWYSTARWQRIRLYQLTAHPLCKRCLETKPSRITTATVVHHVEQHHGDPGKFWSGPFASLCKRCHDSTEHRAEMIGYDTSIGPDGLPADPAHPFNR